MLRLPPTATLFPYTTLFRSRQALCEPVSTTKFGPGPPTHNSSELAPRCGTGLQASRETSCEPLGARAGTSPTTPTLAWPATHPAPPRAQLLESIGSRRLVEAR